MKHFTSLKSRLVFITALFILVVSCAAILMGYFWSVHYFTHMFDDQIIDSQVLAYKNKVGVQREWILGATTDNIAVIEYIHGEKVADTIEGQAKAQETVKKLYQEKIDGRNLLYTIQLDTSTGETLYNYSVIENIYADVFPKLAISLVVFALILVICSVHYYNSICKALHKDLKRMSHYTKHLGRDPGPLVVETRDQSLMDLVGELEDMQAELDQEKELRQSALQYISHEMKTPIMIIDGYATAAIDHIYPKGTLQASMETIRDQSERMRTKVNDLLTIVHLESVDETAEDEDVAVLSCINDILKLFSTQLKSKTVRVNVQPTAVLRGNGEKIRILFENLITNQMKYSASLIEINQTRRNGHLMLTFYNDGAPIPVEMRERMFQPFMKSYGTSSGLGISICKTIMDQMGGTIRLGDSGENGTLFELEFPPDVTNPPPLKY